MVDPSNLDLRYKKFRTISEASIRSMVRSMERAGQITPVAVTGDGPQFVLIDGFKRHRAAEILGMKMLMAIVICAKGAFIKAHIYLLNKKSGFSIIEEGMLIRELVEQDGLQQVEVAIMLERHKSWVSRRLDLIRRLSPQIAEDINLGLIPSGSAFALARLPQCNQADMGCVIQTHKLQTKECSLLIDLWCKAEDEAAREFLIKFPRQAMEIAVGKGSAERIDPRIPARACAWLKTVRCLDRVAVALRLKSKYQIEALEDKVHQILCQALDQADTECGKALSEARKILSKSIKEVSK